MTTITDAALRLKDICNRFGDDPAARGALDEEFDSIRQTFTMLEFPLPSALLDVYRVTIGIPGVLNSEPVLMTPCRFLAPPFVRHIHFLSSELEDSRKEGVLWLGRGNKGDLIIDRDGQCALEPEFLENGTIRLVDPTDFETAFLAYVERHEKEIREAFEEA